MNAITREEVEKIARLSYIDIREGLLAQFSSVVQYASRVKEIRETKKTNIAPLPIQSNVLRQDVVFPTNSDLVLENTPQKEGNYIVVPMILEQH